MDFRGRRGGLSWRLLRRLGRLRRRLGRRAHQNVDLGDELRKHTKTAPA